jgi:hypothetical protein
MKKAEAEQAVSALIDKWAEATGQPMPPDGQFHYSFTSFWNWVQANHFSYTQFRAVPSARYVMEMWFDKEMRQSWRN